MFYSMKNASSSGSSKSQMLPSSLTLPASFFKVLPLPQKFNRFHRFRFQLPLPLPHPWLGENCCFNLKKISHIRHRAIQYTRLVVAYGSERVKALPAFKTCSGHMESESQDLGLSLVLVAGGQRQIHLKWTLQKCTCLQVLESSRGQIPLCIQVCLTRGPWSCMSCSILLELWCNGVGSYGTWTMRVSRPTS